MYVCVYVCIDVFMYACTCVCMYVCMHAYTHARTILVCMHVYVKMLNYGSVYLRSIRYSFQDVTYPLWLLLDYHIHDHNHTGYLADFFLSYTLMVAIKIPPS